MNNKSDPLISSIFNFQGLTPHLFTEFLYMCMFICVYMRETDRQTGRQRERERKKSKSMLLVFDRNISQI